MKRVLLIMMAGVAVLSTASCAGNGGGNNAKSGAGPQKTADPKENVIEVVEEEISDEPRVYSNAYDGYTNVRKEPSAKAEVLGKLRNGSDYAVLLGQSGDWIEVEHDGEVGYVLEKYVSDTPSEPVTVDVDGDWLEGVWFTNGGWTCYLIFNTGKYVKQGEWYEDITYGKWHLEGNEIVLTATYCNKQSRWWDDSFKSERLVIDEENGTVGGVLKSDVYESLEEDEEAGGSMVFSKEEFKAEKKRIGRAVK